METLETFPMVFYSIPLECHGIAWNSIIFVDYVFVLVGWLHGKDAVVVFSSVFISYPRTKIRKTHDKKSLQKHLEFLIITLSRLPPRL